MSRGDNPQDGAARLTRLEEHAGYTERLLEELSEEIRVLNQRIRDATRRLDVLEGRLGAVVERIEKPPTPDQDA